MPGVTSLLEMTSPLLAFAAPEHLRQPRDVAGDAPRLVCREYLRLPRFGIILSRVDAREAGRPISAVSVRNMLAA
jgi:hypothetical protein